MVMPRSRSMSMESRICSFISREETLPHSWIIRSERVDLPWSMWAMIEKLRISLISVMGGLLSIGSRRFEPAKARRGEKKSRRRQPPPSGGPAAANLLVWAAGSDRRFCKRMTQPPTAYRGFVGNDRAFLQQE